MAEYRLSCVAEIERQMAFAPLRSRLQQLDAAEALLLELDADRAYPPDFVLFRITGFHRKTGSAGELLTGLALQHDLGLLLERGSEPLDLRADGQPQPVLDLDEVCRRFNVSSKTIQRWRRRGLPARRYQFADGRKRVGFLLGSVERFVGGHAEQVRSASNFSQVDDHELGEILRRARRLASLCGGHRQEVARRIGRRLNRSPLTVLHLVDQHDRAHPDQAIFPQGDAPLTAGQRAEAERLFAAGHPLRSIARRLGRTRVEIYRVVLDARVRAALGQKCRFIDDELFHQPDAAEVIDQIINQDALGEGSGQPELRRVPTGLPPYLADLYRRPLLTPSRERGLFLRYNYCKYRYATLAQALDENTVRARHLRTLDSWYRQAQDARNALAEANLRLVVSVARRHLRPGVDFMELVSEGNLTLLRAIESFDVARGNRFSTYATLALMKGFARAAPALAGASAAGSGRITALPESLPDQRGQRDVELAENRDLAAGLLSRLSRRERGVVDARFGLAGESCSLRQTAAQLGLSRRQVRRLELSALAKMASAADDVLGYSDEE